MINEEAAAGTEIILLSLGFESDIRQTLNHFSSEVNQNSKYILGTFLMLRPNLTADTDIDIANILPADISDSLCRFACGDVLNISTRTRKAYL